MAVLCKILNLGPRGSEVDAKRLRSSYLALSRAVHPDKASDFAGHVSLAQMHEAFLRVNLAHGLLKELGCFTVPTDAGGQHWNSRQQQNWSTQQQQQQQPGWLEECRRKQREQEEAMRQWLHRQQDRQPSSPEEQGSCRRAPTPSPSLPQSPIPQPQSPNPLELERETERHTQTEILEQQQHRREQQRQHWEQRQSCADAAQQSFIPPRRA